MSATSVVVPPIFLGVAAFLLYIVITRLVQAEREQIGLIKAFGYTDFEVALHYFKMVVVIAVLGAAMGCALGLWGGRLMAGFIKPSTISPFWCSGRTLFSCNRVLRRFSRHLRAGYCVARVSALHPLLPCARPLR